MPRGGMKDMNYGGRREIRLFLDRELSHLLDEAAMTADMEPEAMAIAMLWSALGP